MEVEEDHKVESLEVNLPSTTGRRQDPELERETGERRRGRDIMVAMDHELNSKLAFDWAIAHFCRMADTLHLVHVVPNQYLDFICGISQGPDSDSRLAIEAARVMMEKLATEAYEVAMVKTVGRIVEGGDVGRALCDEAVRIKPAALVMGTRGRGIIKSVLQGSVSEYCFHRCTCPVVIVPARGDDPLCSPLTYLKEAGDQSVV